jgi:hypothetical protein
VKGAVCRSGWNAMVLATVVVAGCKSGATEVPSGGARLLTGIEMDQVTAGSALAVNQVEALGLGAAPQTTAFTSTLADSGGSPIAGAPFINYASSQAAASSASNGTFVQAGGSNQIQVYGSGGGAWLDAASTATAIGSEPSNAETNMQFTGFSLNHLDFVYGSIAAVACCNPLDTTQATVDSGGGGPYTKQLQGAPVSDMPGQIQSRIDDAVASSTLPLLDAGDGLTITAPRLSQSISQ